MEHDRLAAQAPGWAALIQAQRALYPDQPTPLRWMPGPNDRPSDLEGVVAYRAQSPAWHWHYITEGLSDLRGQHPSEAPDAASGQGFEFTFRLLDAAAGNPNAYPPQWPVSLLREFATDAIANPDLFTEGKQIQLGGSILTDRPTPMDTLALVADRELGPIRTASGRVEFRQVVGISRREQEAALNWSLPAVMALMEQRYPMLITMLERGDLMDDPAFRAEVAAGAGRDGSSTRAAGLRHLAWRDEGDDHILELHAQDIVMLKQLLPARLGFGRELYLIAERDGEQVLLLLAAGENNARSGVPSAVQIDRQTALALADTLKAQPGDYRVNGLSGLVWRVVAD